jgi:hypothetical protein
MKQSAGDHAYDLCRRYINDAERSADKAIKMFYFLQSKRHTRTVPALQVVSNQQVRNEPRKNPPDPPVAAPQAAETAVRTVKRAAKPAAKPPKDRKIA